MSQNSGLSLLELVVVIGVVSMVLALGVPAFEQIIHTNRLVAEANKMIRTVHLAKNEAAKHNREVVICPSLDGSKCVGNLSAWQDGWLLFVNLDRDRPVAIDDGEPRLLAHRVSPTVNVVANRMSFAFHHFAKRSTNGTIVFCSAQGKSAPRAVVVSYTGRPRVARTRTDGRPYACEH